MFEAHRVGPEREANIVRGILFDGSGNLWCGCESGIYRASVGSTPLAFEKIHEAAAVDSKQFGCVDDRGRVWLSTTNDGIVEFRDQGRRPSHAAGCGRRAADRAPARRGKGSSPPSIRRRSSSSSARTATARGCRWRRLPVRFAPYREARCAACASKDTLWLGHRRPLRWRDGAETAIVENGLPDASRSGPSFRGRSTRTCGWRPGRRASRGSRGKPSSPS